MRLRCRPSPRLIVGAFLSFMLLMGVGVPGVAIAQRAVGTSSATPQATPGASPVATPQAQPESASDPSRSGSLPGPIPEGEIGVHWAITGEGEPGTPVAVGDLVLLRNGTTLTAWQLADGEVAWEFSRDSALSDPFISSGVAYLTDDSMLIALDATTGEIRWETNLAFGTATATAASDEIVNTPLQPVVAEGVVYVLSGTLAYAIDATNGDYIWRYDAQVLVANMPPTVTESSIIYAASNASNDQVTLALGRETGQLSLNLGPHGYVAGFASDDDLVVVWDGQSLATFYDYSGVATLDYSCPQAGAPVIIDGQIIAVCAGDLVRIDPSTGEMQFLMTASGRIPLGVTDQGLILTGSDDAGRYVTAIDVSTLEPLWHMTLPPTVEGMLSPTGTTANGMVIVMTRTAPETEDDAPGFTLAGVGGTAGSFGQPLPLIANPPAPGSFMRIANETNLLAAPSIEGAPIAELAAGDQVLITGQIEEVDGATWWQVDDPRSGRTGWITPDVFEAGDE